MLSCENISCIRGDKILFEDLSFDIDEGRAIIVRGPNGSGKTSLLKMIVGLLPYTEGRIEWDGVEINHSDEFYKNICYIGHKNGFKNQSTVMHNLKFWHSVYCSKKNINDVVERMDISEVIDIPCHMLSAGWQRKVALARLLLNEAELWIIDEPCAYLDTDAKSNINQIIFNHINDGGSAIIADHINEYEFGDELHIASYARRSYE